MSEKCTYCESGTAKHLASCPEDETLLTEEKFRRMRAFATGFNEVLACGGSQPKQNDPTYLLGWNAGFKALC